MTLRLYNVLTRQKEPFATLHPNQVTLYVCGPTVYHNAHVGHAMSAMVFDIIRRYLEYRGYTVHHAMNYTDVDDKIIQRANELGKEPLSLAERYITAFGRHIDELNILPATYYPRATEYMSRIIDFIGGLIAAGYAYPTPDGSVYFRVEQDADYGKLARRRVEDMQAGARIDVNELKEHPMDFALWKAAKPHEPAWESPWGLGRPGWHIECSTMVHALFGDTIDIHGGGNDLLFPHHENEIAQSESLTGHPLARYWVHNGMLQLGGEKMSKSLGNLVTIDDFLSQHDADALRLIILGSSYRAPLTFNDEVIDQAERSLERLRGALRAKPNGADPAPLLTQLEATRQGFVDAMDDDFNTAGALSHLYNLVRAIHIGGDAPTVEAAQATLHELAGVLDLRLMAGTQANADAAPFVDLLLEIRQALRSQKAFALSDQIRDRLTELGVVVEDGAEGVGWRWQS